MKSNQIIQSAAKFSNVHLAESYRDRAFETTGTSLMIVMVDSPYYVVCSRRQASILVKEGYEVL